MRVLVLALIVLGNVLHLQCEGLLPVTTTTTTTTTANTFTSHSLTNNGASVVVSKGRCGSFFDTTSVYTARTVVSLLYFSASNVPQNQDDNDDNLLFDGIRLNKVFKATHSRRQADAMIESGRVTVNGIPVTEKGGFKVRPFCDVVTLDGKTIEGWEAMNGIVADTEPGEAVPTSQKKRNASSNELQNDDTSHNSKTFEYIKYWKPRGITCTTDRTVPSNIIDDLFNERGYNPRHRIYPVGRLDKDTSGLIVLTSDGRLPNSALRGQFKQPKVYRVMVDRELHNDDLQQLRDGVVITTVAQRDGNRSKPLTAPTLPCRVERIPHTQRRGVTMTLVEGRNRQIRKMMQSLGYEVTKLHRIQFMGITLDPLQREGDWIPLDEEEMRLVEQVLQNAETAQPFQ